MKDFFSSGFISRAIIARGVVIASVALLLFLPSCKKEKAETETSTKPQMAESAGIIRNDLSLNVSNDAPATSSGNAFAASFANHVEVWSHSQYSLNGNSYAIFSLNSNVFDYFGAITLRFSIEGSDLNGDVYMLERRSDGYYYYTNIYSNYAGGVDYIDISKSQVGNGQFGILFFNNSQNAGSFLLQLFKPESISVSSNTSSGTSNLSSLQLAPSSFDFDALGLLSPQCTHGVLKQITYSASIGELNQNYYQNLYDGLKRQGSGRHARYWPNFINGTWFDTNTKVLPIEHRKVGTVVVYKFGQYGHVAVVGEISADKRYYKVIESNLPVGGSLRKNSRWLDFQGDDSRGFGLYPYFLVE